MFILVSLFYILAHKESRLTFIKRLYNQQGTCHSLIMHYASTLSFALDHESRFRLRYGRSSDSFSPLYLPIGLFPTVVKS